MGNQQTEVQNTMDKIVGLAKRRGFIFSGSEIYGGLAGTWDYGPLGVELKNNLKKEFWRRMVYARDDTVGIDAAIMMNPKVWDGSGHTAAFSDPLVECKTCHERFRADHAEEIEAHVAAHKLKRPAAWRGAQIYDRHARLQPFLLLVGRQKMQ